MLHNDYMNFYLMFSFINDTCYNLINAESKTMAMTLKNHSKASAMSTEVVRLLVTSVATFATYLTY